MRKYIKADYCSKYKREDINILLWTVVSVGKG